MKKLMATLLSLCLLATLFPAAALAAEGETVGTAAASITGLSVSVDGTSYPATGSENLQVSLPSNALVTNCSVTVTTSEEVTPQAATSSAVGDLYVASVSGDTATLYFNLTAENVNLNDANFALTATKTNATTWTVAFTGQAFEGMTLDVLAAMLNADLRLAAGALNGTSAAQPLLVNYDNSNTVITLCAADAVVRTVTYVVSGNSYLWRLPNGAVLPLPNYGQEGWYSDSTYGNALASDATVNGNMTIYGKTTTGSTGNFLEDLTAGHTATIQTLGDWDAFVTNVAEADAGQLIRLGADIDCNNKTYDPLVFKGNFDGQNFAIENASFNAVPSKYNTSSENDINCSGVFASIGPGQIIANLKLVDITAKASTTYSGVLAGLADGTDSAPALIQNVQVTGGSAAGRTAAGLVGFIRNTTVQFCSSTGTRITGAANGGGIVGINNAKVVNCYSTTSPTALAPFLGGNTGGVISKNVRGGYAQYCWSIMETIGDPEDGGTNTFIMDSVNADTWADDFQGFNETYWDLKDGTATSFKENPVKYVFSSST